MKKFRFLTVIALLVASLYSCDSLTGDPELPFPLDETLSNTGAFLRVLSVSSPGFDVADLSTAAYTFTGEVSDVNNGQDVTNVDFYVSYSGAAGTVAEPSSPISSYTAGDMTVREESGLPSAEFNITLNSILSYLSIDIDDLALGDVFTLRWVVVTTDGTTYSVEDASSAIAGGFYVSPYTARASVVQSIPTDIFVGPYTFTQDVPGSNLFGVTSIFGTDPTFELQVNASNALNGRSMPGIIYLPAFGGFTVDVNLLFFRRQDFQTFVAADNYITVDGKQNTGVGCGGPGLNFNPITDETVSDFDVDDDSGFTLAFTDNVDSECGGSPVDVTFTVVQN